MRGFLRFVSEWKTAASLSFTAAAVIYAAVSLLYGGGDVGIGKLLSPAARLRPGPAPSSTCALPTTSSKKMRYTRRALLFLALFFPLLAGAAWLFRWFPRTSWGRGWCSAAPSPRPSRCSPWDSSCSTGPPGGSTTASWASTAGSGSAVESKARRGSGSGKTEGNRKKPAGAGQDLLRPAPAGFLPKWMVLFFPAISYSRNSRRRSFSRGPAGCSSGASSDGAFRLSSGSGWGAWRRRRWAGTAGP